VTDNEPIIAATALEERQELLAHHVRLVTRGLSNGLFVYGSRGGLGKTKVILQTLRQERALPIRLNGHITPLSLYTTLFHHQDRVIFIDDADSLYRNLPALGILRSALWGDVGAGRLVTYNSSQLAIAPAFEFSGRLVLTANTLPRNNAAFDAVLSRVDIFELDATNPEVIEMMRMIATKGYDNVLTPDDCKDVVDFIAQYASTRELSLRLLEPSFRKVIYAKIVGVDWRDLVRSQLDQIGRDNTPKLQQSTADVIEALKQVVRDFPDSVNDQQQAWSQLTGKSRASFYRLKKTALEKKSD